MSNLEQAKILFIGGGNMANAMMMGLLHKGFSAKHIEVIEPVASSREKISAQLNISCHENLAQLKSSVSSFDVIVFAIKPQQFKAVATDLSPWVKECQSTVFLSIAAGIRTTDITRWLGHSCVIRAMPNTPALIGQGMTGLYASQGVNEAQKNLVQDLCESFGAALWFEHEDQLNDVTAISGSGPAYVFAFIEAFEDAARARGLTPEQAKLLVKETILGAIALANQSPDSPSQLREKVTSKGGTTFAALEVLREKNWSTIFSQAIDAASHRSEELAKELGQ